MKLTYLRVCADRISNLLPRLERTRLPDIRTVVLRNGGLVTVPCPDLLVPRGIRHVYLPYKAETGLEEGFRCTESIYGAGVKFSTQTSFCFLEQQERLLRWTVANGMPCGFIMNPPTCLWDVKEDECLKNYLTIVYQYIRTPKLKSL